MNRGLLPRISRAALLAAGMLLAAGCTGDRGAGSRPGEIVVYEPDGEDAGRLEITTVAERALVRAELRLPDGRVEPATILEHGAVGGAAGNVDLGVGVGVFGGSSSGIGPGLFLGAPILGGWSGRRPYLRSRARIVLDDAAAYRRDWPDAQVHLDFGEGADPRTVQLPAPAPRPP